MISTHPHSQPQGSDHNEAKQNKGCVTHSLAIYILKYLKAKEEL